jgi:hypothetical protein
LRHRPEVFASFLVPQFFLNAFLPLDRDNLLDAAQQNAQPSIFLLKPGHRNAVSGGALYYVSAHGVSRFLLKIAIAGATSRAG